MRIKLSCPCFGIRWTKILPTWLWLRVGRPLYWPVWLWLCFYETLDGYPNWGLALLQVSGRFLIGYTTCHHPPHKHNPEGFEQGYIEWHFGLFWFIDVKRETPIVREQS